MLRFHHHESELDFISTLATFGTPLDITPAELIIESLYPADADTATATAMTYHAATWSKLTPIHRPSPARTTASQDAPTREQAIACELAFLQRCLVRDGRDAQPVVA